MKRNRIGGPWVRVPVHVLRDLCGGERLTDAQAWAALLSRWHDGHDISAGEFMRLCGWGKGRTLAFMERVAAWAVDNGAALPDRWGRAKADRSTDRQRTGSREEECELSEPTGPNADRFRTASCARDPLLVEEREREENTNGGSSPPVATGRHDGADPDALPSPPRDAAPVVPEEPAPEPDRGKDVDPAGGGSDAAGGAAVAGGEGKPLTADVLASWEAWRAFHPSARATPSKGAARMLRGALKAATAAQVASVIRWAHLAPHERASFLRGPEYERGESNVGAYLGVENLLVGKALDTRIAWATEWEAAGSPDYRDAPREVAHRVEELSPKDRKAISTMRYLIDQGDPEAHPDPVHARSVLAAWTDCPGTAGLAVTRNAPAHLLDRALMDELRRIRAWLATPPREVTDGR